MTLDSTKRFRVVLTNDDGPPGPDSPYMVGWYRHLTQDLGWDVKVVIPSTQKSWIGGAYLVNDTIEGRYYYPKESGGEGEITLSPRGLKEGEIGEWILLDATPASCTNIALQNLFPGEIDLVISGPNYGRNTSSALSLSSGTLGAAIASSLSGTRSIALSYGNMNEDIPTTFHEPAFKLSSKIINHLINNWSTHENRVLYSINIPMIKELLHKDELKIYWTTVWRSNHARLFVRVENAIQTTDAARKDSGNTQDVAKRESLVFAFKPDLSGVLSLTAAPEGSDSWALNVGAASVTPYLTCFAEPPESEHSFSCIQDREWKF